MSSKLECDCLMDISVCSDCGDYHRQDCMTILSDGLMVCHSCEEETKREADKVYVCEVCGSKVLTPIKCCGFPTAEYKKGG